jgi:hypothetical protein
VNVGRFAVAVAAWSPAPDRDRPRFEGLLKRVEAALQACEPQQHARRAGTRRRAQHAKAQEWILSTFGSPLKEIECIVPTLLVADVRRAAESYARVLGFKVSFLAEEPGQAAYYCGMSIGPATIHLAQIESRQPGVSYKGACYLRLRSGVVSMSPRSRLRVTN